MVDEPIGDENLDADVGVMCLKSADERGQQRFRYARRRRQPQGTRDIGKLVRHDVVDGFAQLGATLRMLEDFRSDVGKPQAARGAFQQTDAKLVFKVGDAAAYS